MPRPLVLPLRRGVLPRWLRRRRREAALRVLRGEAGHHVAGDGGRAAGGAAVLVKEQVQGSILHFVSIVFFLEN